LCHSWFGDDGGGAEKKGRPPLEEKSAIRLSHDGRKWVFKRDGKVVAESPTTFAPGDREWQKERV
jgi:hypothetical protein